MESYGANEARLKMRDILTAVERGEHIELKRYDTPSGVIVPVDWHDAAEEALSVISLMLEDKDSGREWQSGMTKLAECLTRAGLPRYAPSALVPADPKENDR